MVMLGVLFFGSEIQSTFPTTKCGRFWEKKKKMKKIIEFQVGNKFLLLGGICVFAGIFGVKLYHNFFFLNNSLKNHVHTILY